MKHACLLLPLLICFSGHFPGQAAEPKPAEPVIDFETTEGELDIDFTTGIAVATNTVVIKYADTVLTAKKLRLNLNTGDAEAEDDVHIQRDGGLWTGDRIQYNFKTRQITGAHFKAGYPPFVVAGDGLDTDLITKAYSATNAFITTDDYAEPGYRLRAKKIRIVPGDYIEAWGGTFYLGSTPVMYYAYYKRSLGRHPNNFSFVPGYRSRFGPYLLGTYNWYWNQQLNGALNLDLRQKRGVGFGPDFTYDLGQFGHGTFRYYYTKDDAPGRDPEGRALPENRQRVFFTHTATLRTNLTVKAVVRYQSDIDVIRDFFETEYRQNIHPSSFLEVDQLWPNFSLNLLAQPRVNDFYETVERLPDVKLTAFRQQLGASPFYYEGESSLGYYRREFAHDTPGDFAAFRADTYHQVLLPWNFFGWLNVAPRIGERLTYYGEADGPGATTSEHQRAVFNTGVEVSTKASRVWRNVESQFLELKELRHIIEPSVNYVYVPQPHPRPPLLPQFDYELGSYRLLPIDYPDYNRIDSIDSQNVLRFSLRNKLQTKRESGIENVLNWALYTDWRLKPRPGQSTFADFYSDLDFKPRSWLTFSSETRFNVRHERFDEANHMVTIHPNNRWSLTLGHRYRMADPAFNVGTNVDVGNNLIISSLYFRLNENWGLRMSHHFEARDGRMEDQFYTIYRDWRSWTSAITFRVRDTRVGPDDYTIAITFSLKAFPRFKLGDDTNRQTLLLGS